MKPEHVVRRTIIREWMSLPQDKRQTEQQATDFAARAMEKHEFRCGGDRSAMLDHSYAGVIVCRLC